MADGREFIEIVEVVRTRALGNVAIYRQWITDPDGAEATAPWAPRWSSLRLRRESTLRGTLNGGDYYREASEAAKPKLRRRKPALKLLPGGGDAA